MLGLHESCMAFLICLRRQTFQVMHVLHSKLLMALRYTSPSSCIIVLTMSSGSDLSSHTTVGLHAQQLQKHDWVLGPGSNVQYLVTSQLKMADSLKQSWLDISAAWAQHTTEGWLAANVFFAAGVYQAGCDCTSVSSCYRFTCHSFRWL